MAIKFFTSDVSFNLKNKRLIKNWIDNAILNEAKISGDISIILCSEAFLLKLNQDFLQHDTFTDIITFDNTEGIIIAGELYISIDRVRENANSFTIDFTNELLRVMIHGVLHLCGYGDKKPNEIKKIREREDFYLGKFN